MNYAGERRSVLTLAHELGRGLHGWLAQELGLLNASTPLTLAKTSSVFGEALTFERLMEREDDPRARARPARSAGSTTPSGRSSGRSRSTASSTRSTPAAARRASCRSTGSSDL